MTPRKHHLIATCLILVTVTAAALAITAAAASPPKITNCTTAAARPKTLTLTCGDGNTFLKGLTWSSFGGTTAAASGSFVVNTCEPNCASGKDSTFPVKVKASTFKKCKRTLRVYEKVALTFPGRQPGPVVPRTWKLGCPT